jgi:putative protein kinase ArgK-like GTPase of G3E family
MTKEQLQALKKAAMEMAQISCLMNESDDQDESNAVLAMLTAQSGCFTTLVHVAEMMKTLVDANTKTEKGYLQ